MPSVAQPSAADKVRAQVDAQAAAAKGYRIPWPDQEPDDTEGGGQSEPQSDRAQGDKYSLDIFFADQLSDEYEPTEELVEGLLTAGDSAIFFGDSNSGKTFVSVDIGCAVARGIPWMGRKTELGLVVYLAAESPSSVRRRLQAYQRFHQCRVPNFVVVQSPIDLFDGDADTERVVRTVKEVEAKLGQPVRLVIGDTLARLSAGANENSAQDMGLVVRRVDRIRTACKAHFLLVHHCGKNSAAGARGWSGLKAAVDTELEISDSPSGRCVEITKQRDLASKGDRIGFRLEQVLLGLNKWGTPATTCVVLPASAPAKPVGKRLSEVAGAIVEYLRCQSAGMKKGLVVKHFDGQYDKSAIYRELKKLVEAGQVNECVGIVSINADLVQKGAN